MKTRQVPSARLLAALAAGLLCLGLTGCSGGTQTPTNSPAVTTPATESPVVSNWSEEDKQAFADSCKAQAGDAPGADEYCRCNAEKFAEIFPNIVDMGNATDAQIQEVADICNAQVNS